MFKTQLFRVLMLALAFGTVFTSCKDDDDDDNVNTDIAGSISDNTTWTADQVWTISGFVVVESGATLTIEPGTIIKAAEGDGENSTALVVAKGGKINAVGTPDAPIIFTSVLDGIQPGEKVGTLDENDKGLWGGVIVLGNAPISDGDGGATAQIEGIPAGQTFGEYGGSVVGDNSGTIQYVSIRHNGTALRPNEELQGLTLGGVGNGTVIDHVEVVASDDDGVEIFGGSVNLNHIAIFYQSDDGLDLDQSYSGTVSNLYIKHAGGGEGNAGFEFDGPEDSGVNPDGKYTVSNATVKNDGGSGGAALLKSGSQGTINNCSFWGYSSWVTIEGGSANANVLSNDLQLTNCQFTAAAITDAFVSVEAADSTAEADSIGALVTAQLQAATGNTVSTRPSVGATLSDFTGWTWASEKGKLD